MYNNFPLSHKKSCTIVNDENDRNVAVRGGGKYPKRGVYFRRMAEYVEHAVEREAYGNYMGSIWFPSLVDVFYFS